MKKFLWTIFLAFSLYVGLLSAATLSLTDAPNEGQWGGYKATINANWALIEAMVSLSGDATVDASGVITVTGSTGAFQAGTFFGVAAHSTTGGLDAAITPTSSYVLLNSSVLTTNSIVAPVVAGMSIGDRLLIVNELAQAVTFADGTPLQLSGTLVLGQYDTLDLVVVSTGEYAQVSTSNN